MSTYGRIVYTRRRAGYDFNGKPNDNVEGYGVHSCTEGFFEKYCKSGNAYLTKVLQARNFQRLSEDDPVLYAYFVSPDGKMKLLERTTLRSEKELMEAVKDGVDTRVDHVLEAFAGDFDESPSSFIAREPFAAHQKSVGYYYSLSEPLPFEKPVVFGENPSKGAFWSSVESFVSSSFQRKEDIRLCAAWLISEFDKPIEERRTLLIPETGENVRMWVAGITSVLPDKLASQVGFCTLCDVNKTAYPLYIQVNKETLECVQKVDLTNPLLLSVQKFNIIGVDGKGMRQADPKTVTLDMIRSGSESDPRIAKSSLLADIGSNRKQIEYFAYYLQDMENVKIGRELCDLYDAIDVVSTVSKWKYEELISAIDVLLPHLNSGSTLTKHLRFHLLEEQTYEKNFFKKDQTSGLNLLNKMAAVESLAGGNGERVTAIVGRVIENALSSAKNFTLNDSENLNVVTANTVGSTALEQIKSDKLSEALDMDCPWNQNYTEKVLTLFGDVINEPKNEDVIDQLINSSMNYKATFDVFCAFMRNRMLDPVPVRCGAKYGSNWYCRLLEKGYDFGGIVEAVKRLRLNNEEVIIKDLVNASARTITNPAEQLDRVLALISNATEEERMPLIKSFDLKILMTEENNNFKAALALRQEAGNKMTSLVNSNILVLLSKLNRSSSPHDRAQTWIDQQAAIEKYAPNFPSVNIRNDRGIGASLFAKLQRGSITDFAMLLRIGVMAKNRGWLSSCQTVVKEETDKINGGELLSELCAFEAFRLCHEKLPKECSAILDEDTLREIGENIMPALTADFGRINIEKRRNTLLKKVHQYGKEAESIMTMLIDSASEIYKANHKGFFDSLSEKIKNIGNKKDNH